MQEWRVDENAETLKQAGGDTVGAGNADDAANLSGTGMT